MATAAQLSLSSGLIKRNYGAGEIPNCVGQESPTFQEFLKNRIRYTGGGEVAANTSGSWTPGIRFAVITQLNRAVGSKAQMGALPSAKASSVVQTQANMTFLYGGITLEGQQIKLVKTDRESFLDIIQMEKENLAATMAFDAERQMFSATLGTVDDLGTLKILFSTDQYVREGDVVDTYSGATIHGNSLTVSALDYDTAPEGKVWATLDSITSVALGDLIYREDAKGYEVITFDAALSSNADGNDSYLGIANSDSARWQAYVKSNVNAKFDMKAHFIDPIWACYKRYGTIVKKLWVNESIVTAYVLDGTIEVRRILENGKQEPITKLDRGFSFGKGLVITHPVGGGTEVMVKAVTAVPKGVIYGHDPKYVGIAAENEPNWMQGWYGPGNIFTQVIDGDGKKYDAYEAHQYLYWLLVMKKRCGLKITGILT